MDSNLPPLLAPTPENNDQVNEERNKREENELLCRRHIFNSLSDRLYDLYTSVNSPKNIWKALEFKYNLEDLQGVDKFLNMKYFEFS